MKNQTKNGGASLDNHDREPQTLVVIAGPTFVEAMKFLLLGAALGALAMRLLSPGEASLADEHNQDGHTAAAGTRIKVLAQRVQLVVRRAREVALGASEALRPTLEQAVATGRQAAGEIEAKLKQDVQQAGDQPALARLDTQKGNPDNAAPSAG
jgi:hypothetical protein